MPCAIPPLDQTTVAIGRGYGLGYNRERTARDQLHGGMDFVASSGTPVLAPVAGVVDFTSANTGTRINADSARAGSVGQVRRMGGYGNAVVLRHDTPVPGLPSPFYTSYNHLSAIAPGIAPGAVVAPGTLLGNVGNTTNGQFAGMGAHLHMELRRVPFPGSYDRDTMDPSLLFTALGIDWLDYRREVERGVGGHLLIRAGGPSDPAVCGGVRGLDIAIPTGRTAIAIPTGKHRAIPYIPGIGIPGVPFLGLEGLGAYLGALPGGEVDPGFVCFGGELGYAPSGYVDPVRIATKYSRYGSTQVPRPGSPAADVMPPDYAPAAAEAGGASSGSSLVIGGTLAALLAWRLLRRS